MSETIKFRLEQDTAEGLWVSEELEARDMRYVRQAVIAAFVGDGQPRRAVVDGKVVYALDAHGKERLR